MRVYSVNVARLNLQRLTSIIELHEGKEHQKQSGVQAVKRQVSIWNVCRLRRKEFSGRPRFGNVELAINNTAKIEDSIIEKHQSNK